MRLSSQTFDSFGAQFETSSDNLKDTCKITGLIFSTEKSEK